EGRARECRHRGGDRCTSRAGDGGRGGRDAPWPCRAPDHHRRPNPGGDRGSTADRVRRVHVGAVGRARSGQPGWGGTGRGAGRQAEPSLLRFEGYTLDAGGRTLRNAGGQDIALTRAEFSMLLALARQAGRVLSRDELSQTATGRGAQPEDRSIDVLISRLRRKIEPIPKTPRIILTVPGQGYNLGVAAQVIVSPAPPLAAAPADVAPSAAARVARQ